MPEIIDPDVTAQRIARQEILSACLAIENGIQAADITMKQLKAERDKLSRAVNVLYHLSKGVTHAGK